MTTQSRNPRTLRLPAAAALFSLFLIAAACEAPESEEQLQPPPAQPAMEVSEATVELEPVEDSGVSGQATASHTETEVTVVLEVEGLPGAGEYAAHIHSGTCAEGGPVAVPLSAVVAGDDGDGTSTTALDAEDMDHDGSHFFQIHSADGPPVACGDLEMDTLMEPR
jgi:Cu/Zn superoxide dismutase